MDKFVLAFLLIILIAGSAFAAAPTVKTGQGMLGAGIFDGSPSLSFAVGNDMNLWLGANYASTSTAGAVGQVSGLIGVEKTFSKLGVVNSNMGIAVMYINNVGNASGVTNLTADLLWSFVAPITNNLNAGVDFRLLRYNSFAAAGATTTSFNLLGGAVRAQVVF